jgi:hypothetical protein
MAGLLTTALNPKFFKTYCYASLKSFETKIQKREIPTYLLTNITLLVTLIHLAVKITIK